MAGREKQVAKFGEELDLLHTLVVTHKCVQPLFGNEARVLFLPQVLRHLQHALTCSSPSAMIDRGGPMNFVGFSALFFSFFRFTLLVLFQARFAHLLVPLH